MAENPRHVDEQEEEMRHVRGIGNGIGNAQTMPVRMNMREIQRPVIRASPSCIRLSPAARNYELKNIHFNTLPSFNGLPGEDSLTFLRDFYTTIQTFSLYELTKNEL